MKKALSIVAVLLLIAGVAVSVWRQQRSKEAAAQEQSLVLQSKVQALETDLAESRAREEQKAIAAQPSLPVRLTTPTIPAAVPPTNAAPNPAMLNDPETRTLMRKQQQQALAKIADRIVNTNFARDWNLSPEQTARVKELLREKGGAGSDFTTAMLFDGLNDDALAQRGRETKQKIEQSDAALRDLLGADGFKALKEQEHSIGEREGVKRFREELAAGPEPLQKEQETALLAAISTERQAFSFRIDYDDTSKYDYEHIRDFFSEANLQIYFEDLQQLNTRVAERAALLLSPAQLEQLKTTQSDHLEKARLTVKMTTELFNKRRPN
jgi:hypothetical protein